MNGCEGDGGQDVKMESDRKRLVFMCGYLPGASPERSPLLAPISVNLSNSSDVGSLWKDVCGGGCGFAMALSVFGKLITWGSVDDQGQSYLTSGKHGETPEPFPLPAEAFIVRAAAGWAHCAAVTDGGEVYTWGWKECVPYGKPLDDPSVETRTENTSSERQTSNVTEQGSPHSQVSRPAGGTFSCIDSKPGGQESVKRRKMSTERQHAESSIYVDESLAALPCIVSISGVRIAQVAAGGRHTLALSDAGQVWGWGYGGEGQLGLGSRIRMVSSPHPIMLKSMAHGQGKMTSSVSMSSGGHGVIPGSCVKGIACGGRHSAIITDSGALLTFGWGLHGQCGNGSTEDDLSPTCVSSLLGISIKGVDAGLWHTVCVSADGDVYVFGGNQFGQLGTGDEQAETLPRLLDDSSLESVNAKMVSCGARHSAILTEENKVFCWGWNKYGQLGLGDVIDRNVPSEIVISNVVPKKVACGWWHTLLLAEG